MNLLTSPIPQDLKAHLQSQIQAHEAAGDQVILLVPEQFTLESDRAILDYVGKDASIRILAQSFSAFSRTVLTRLGLPASADLKDASQRILIEKILMDMGQGYSHRGDRDKLLETLVEVRMEGLSPQDLFRAQEDFDHSPLTQDKIGWVARVLQAYEEALSQGLMDQESRLQALVAAIPQAHWLQDTHIIVSDFQDLSRIEIEVLAALEQKAKSLTLYLLSQGQATSHPAFASSQAFLKRLGERIPHRARLLPPETSLAPDLVCLAQGALAYTKPVPGPAKARIHVLRALSVDQEVTYLAGVIRKMVMEDGLRYREIGLTVTNPAVYLPVIDRIFRQNQIPVFIDARRDLLDNPIIRMVLQVLRIIQDRFPLDALVGFLQSGMVDVPLDQVMAYERQALAHKVRWDRLIQPESFIFDEGQARLSARVRAKEADQAQKAGQVAGFLQELFGAYDQVSRRKASVADHAQALYAFLNQEALRSGLDAFQASCLAFPEDGLAEENPQVLEALVKLLDEVVALLEPEVLTYKDFANLVRAGLEGLSIGIIPPAQDQVQVGGLVRLRSEPKPVRMVLGLSDLWMPSQAGDRTVFSDGEKTLLADVGIHFSSRQDRVTDQEALSFYATVLQAQTHLYLSYPLSEASVGAMHPATVITRTLALFPDLQETLVADALPSQALATPPMARSLAMSILREGPQAREEEDRASPSRWVEALGVYRHYLSQAGPTGRFLTAGLAYQKQPHALAPSLAQALYPPLREGRVSISELETIRACPYRHFVRYGLRPEEVSRFDLEPKDFGSILHGALDRLTKDLQEDPDRILQHEDQIMAQMDAYVQEVAEETVSLKRREDPQNKAVLVNIRREARKAGRHILGQLRDMAFRPIAQEVDFGQGKALPPLVLAPSQGRVNLEGRIDRLDGWHGQGGFYLSVIDYKTGFQEFDVTRTMDGLDTQLLLYLKAALGADPKAKPAGVFYLSLKSPFLEMELTDRDQVADGFRKNLRLNGLVVSDQEVLEALGKEAKLSDQRVLYIRQKSANILAPEDLSLLIDYAQSLAEEALEEALSGAIPIRPAQTTSWTACQYCDYVGLCQVEPGDPVARKVPARSWDDLGEVLRKEEA